MKFCMNLMFSIAVIIILAYLSFFLYSSNFFYYRIFALIDNNTTFDSTSLNYAYLGIILYLFNFKSHLNLKINGTYIFDSNTLLHMSDVKIIFNSFLVLFILALFIFIVILKVHQKKKYLSFHFFKRFLIVLSIFFFVLFFFAILDFDSFFSYFHKILFSNDLWLFNENDTIVLLLNTKFFYSLTILIPTTFITFIMIFYLLYKKSLNK